MSQPRDPRVPGEVDPPKQRANEAVSETLDGSGGATADQGTLDPATGHFSVGAFDPGATRDGPLEDPLTTRDPMATRDPDSPAGDPGATGEFSVSPGLGVTGEFSVSPPRSVDPGATMDSLPAAKPPQRERPTVPGYDIISELGRGGMGVVYKAKQQKLKRTVALKMVLSGAHASGSQLVRFNLEAQSVAALQHPNIVQIYEIGEQNGLPFFSLEYVDGQPLDKKLARQPQLPNWSAELVEKLARAMQFAHDHHIIHRDLKPANVLMTKSGEPKIADFGLAKVVEDDDSGNTRSGTIMGSPSYMAPEQARGEVRNVGPLADVYALGSLTYELLTGRPPFQGATILETLEQVQNKEPVAPSTLQPRTPVDLETICLRCLQKEPAKRYASAGDLADDLHRFLAGEPILARPVSKAERAWRWCRRNPRIAIPSAAAVLMMVAATAISTWAAVTVNEKNTVIEGEKRIAQLNAKEAKRQESIAKNNESEAKRQEQIALDNAKEAKRQETIAVENAKAADVARKDAVKNAEDATKQAVIALNTLQTLIKQVQDELEGSQLPGMEKLREQLLKYALDGLDAVAKQADGSTSIEATRAAAHMKIGQLYKQLGQSEKALAQFQKVDEITLQRLDIKKRSDASRTNRAVALLTLGQMAQEMNRDMQIAIDYYRESLFLWEDVLDHPKPPEGDDKPADPNVVKAGLSETTTRVGTTIFRLGKPAEALPYFQRAEVLRKAAADAAPEKPANPAELVRTIAAWSDLARTYTALGEVRFRMDEPAEADRHHQECLAIRERLLKTFGPRPEIKLELARASGRMGELKLHMGALGDAKPLIERSLEYAKELVAANSKLVDYQRDLASAHYRLGLWLDRNGEKAAAKEQFVACRDIREKLMTQDKGNTKREMEYLVSLARCGDHVKAAELAVKVRTENQGDNELLFDVARGYAQCSLAEGLDAEQRMLYLEQSLGAIREAVERGYQDFVYLRVDPDLDPLHDSPEFQALLEKATKAAKG